VSQLSRWSSAARDTRTSASPAAGTGTGTPVSSAMTFLPSAPSMSVSRSARIVAPDGGALDVEANAHRSAAVGRLATRCVASKDIVPKIEQQ
jgi:hypothetical protein